MEQFAVTADEIDADHLLAALTRMHEGLVPAIGSAAADGEPNEELAEAVADVYDDDEFHLGAWEHRIEGELDGEEVSEAVEDPEPRIYRDIEPLIVDDDCVVLTAEWDDSGWYDTETRWRTATIQLVRAEPAPPVNPTPWRIAGKSSQLPDEDWCV